MAKYLKKFETHAEYEAYSGGGEMLLPNVSYCEDNNEVHYNPSVPETRLIAKFNVTDTDNPTAICCSDFDAVYLFTEIEINGDVLPSGEYEYTFNTTGEHIVKYTLNDPTTIGLSAFSGCNCMTSVTIPNSVTYIDEIAFDSTGLVSIDIPYSVTSIYSDAFVDCSSLIEFNVDENNTDYSSIDGVLFNKTQTELIICPAGKQGTCVIPNSVTSIGWIAFYGCSSITSIVIEATTPPVVFRGVFDNTNDCPIYVPSESVEAYKTDSGWSHYASRIQPITV